jgi:RNA polymerase sigma-70 factor (ECF subfamily)
VAPSDSSLNIYMEHRDELLNYANKFLQDRSIAEDVVQEAWLRLSARDGRGDEIANTLSYLYSIVRNLALDLIRRGPREVAEAPDSEMWTGLPSDTPSAEDVAVQRDEMRALMQAISELPQRTQIAFRMYKLEEKSLQEVGAYLGVSVARAHQIVREALLHATARLYGEDEGDGD